MHQKLTVLEVQNNDYQGAIPRLENCLQVIDVIFDAI
jgi:hypothetical protein